MKVEFVIVVVDARGRIVVEKSTGVVAHRSPADQIDFRFSPARQSLRFSIYVGL